MITPVGTVTFSVVGLQWMDGYNYKEYREEVDSQDMTWKAETLIVCACSLH